MRRYNMTILNDMTLRDYFAVHAPTPSNEMIEQEMRCDRNRNPHNESHKPPLRSRTEIEVCLKYAYTDTMMRVRNAEI